MIGSSDYLSCLTRAFVPGLDNKMSQVYPYWPIWWRAMELRLDNALTPPLCTELS